MNSRTYQTSSGLNSYNFLGFSHTQPFLSNTAVSIHSRHIMVYLHLFWNMRSKRTTEVLWNLVLCVLLRMCYMSCRGQNLVLVVYFFPYSFSSMVKFEFCPHSHIAQLVHDPWHHDPCMVGWDIFVVENPWVFRIIEIKKRALICSDHIYISSFINF